MTNGSSIQRFENTNMDFLNADLEALAPFFITALLAYVLRLAHGRKKVPLIEGLMDGLAAVGSGMFIGSVVSITTYPLAAKVAMAGLAGLIGPDILGGLLAITKAFKNSPNQFILKYIYAVKGVKTGMDIPSPTEDESKETNQDQSK